MSNPTSDNLLLSEAKKRSVASILGPFAIDCLEDRTADRIPEDVKELLQDSLAANSRRAYMKDIVRFRSWGGEIPTDSLQVAIYLTRHLDSHAASTLCRWLASIGKAHRSAGFPDPTKNEVVRNIVRAIRRRKGGLQHAVMPLMKSDLFRIVNELGPSLGDVRDKAILLFGFAGGFRRSEIVGLNVEDIGRVREGIVATIKHSKNDPNGVGRQVAIPYASSQYCPVRAMECWLELSAVTLGPVFRPVNRHGTVAEDRLSGEAIALVVKARAAAIGLPPQNYSGHSLRAGFATSAAKEGISAWKIRRQTGHRSESMLSRYIRFGDLFNENAASELF